MWKRQLRFKEPCASVNKEGFSRLTVLLGELAVLPTQSNFQKQNAPVEWEVLSIFHSSAQVLYLRLQSKLENTRKNAIINE